MQKSKTELKKEDLLREINKLKRQANKQIKDVEKNIRRKYVGCKKAKRQIRGRNSKSFFRAP